MSGIDLGERLSAGMERLAGEVTAPPTDAVRQQVRQRAATLRRQRQRTRIAAAAALALAVLGTAVWVRASGWRDDDLRASDTARSADDVTNLAWDPPVGRPQAPPALTVEGMGLQPTTAGDDSGEQLDPEDRHDPHRQVFRQPEDYTGPTVFVDVYPTTPGLLPDGEPEQVDVAGHPAQLVEGPGSLALLWNDDAPRGGVHLTSQGLTRDELVDFARGLRPADQGLGFDATSLPQGMAEDPVDQEYPRSSSAVTGELRLESDTAEVTVHLTHGVGEEDFEAVARHVLVESDQHEQVVVAGRPAILGNAPEGPWIALWRTSTIGYARVDISGVPGAPEPDATTVHEILAGVRQIDDDEWQRLVDQVGPAGD